MTLDELVRDYVNDARPIRFFDNQCSRSEAHQRGITKALLEEGNPHLQNAHKNPSKAVDLGALHSIGEREIRSIRGIGAMIV